MSVTVPVSPTTGRALRFPRSSRRPVNVLTGAVLATGLMWTSCAWSPGPPLPPSATTVTVQMREYAFVYEPPNAPGRVVFEVHNEGRLPHDLVLVPLPADLPPIDEQLRGTTRRDVSLLANIPARPPGSRTVFAVDLEPGRYGLVCFVLDPDGQQHAQKGMSSEFVIP